MGIFDIIPRRKRKKEAEEDRLTGPMEVGDPRPEPTHMAAPASTVSQSQPVEPAPAPEGCEKAECDKTMADHVIDKIRLVYDPEIPVNIYEMGLIYDVLVEGKTARVMMTLTSPQCPAAQEIPADVQGRVMELPEIDDVEVEIVWDPPWDPSKMSELARLELGMF